MNWLFNVITCMLDLLRSWAGIERIHEHHPKKATMKPRKVILTIEVLTDLPIAKLRAADGMSLYYGSSNRYYGSGDSFVGDVDSLTEAIELVQLQANAVSDKPKKGKARR